MHSCRRTAGLGEVAGHEGGTFAGLDAELQRRLHHRDALLRVVPHPVRQLQALDFPGKKRIERTPITCVVPSLLVLGELSHHLAEDQVAQLVVFLVCQGPRGTHPVHDRRPHPPGQLLDHRVDAFLDKRVLREHERGGLVDRAGIGGADVSYLVGEVVVNGIELAENRRKLLVVFLFVFPLFCHFRARCVVVGTTLRPDQESASRGRGGATVPVTGRRPLRRPCPPGG